MCSRSWYCSYKPSLPRKLMAILLTYPGSVQVCGALFNKNPPCFCLKSKVCFVLSGSNLRTDLICCFSMCLPYAKLQSISFIFVYPSKEYNLLRHLLFQLPLQTEESFLSCMWPEREGSKNHFPLGRLANIYKVLQVHLSLQEGGR